MPLNIPKLHHKTLALLLKLSTQELELLSTVLDNMRPALSVRDSIDGALVPNSLSREDTESIIEMLSGMYSLVENNAENIDQFATDLLDSASNISKQNPEMPPISAPLRNSITSFLQKAFTNNSGLPFFVRSATASTDFEKIFIKGEILTDIRPMFQNKSVKSLFTYHQIKITYQSSNTTQEIYTAADDHDLRALRNAIDNALAKSDLIANMAFKNELALLRNSSPIDSKSDIES